MTILAIDPGTNCGWAVRDSQGRYASGVWNLQPKRHEGAGMRLIHLRVHLAAILKAYPITVVAFEEVRRHAGTTAAHIYGEIVGKIREWCEDNKIPYMGVPVATVKRTATGKGNSDKAAMCKATEARWPDMGPAEAMDDNEADARWIAECAAVEAGEGNQQGSGVK